MEIAHLIRLRLAAQRLSPGAEAASPREAAAAVCGVQAQDLRAAALALRVRVPGLDRSALRDAGLVRTWTARGTVHLLPAEDLPWLHALCGPHFLARIERVMDKRGGLDVARALLGDLLDLIANRPLERAEILRELRARGHPSLEQSWVNVLMPWVALQGLALGSPEGLWRAADPPPAVDEDDALRTLATRYLAGFGPAAPADLASWSGLPLRTARGALEAAAPLDEAGDLLALPGTLDADSPEPSPVRLLPAFDTLMLGYRTREPVVAAEHDREVMPGGGIVRAVVLARGRAVGTWKLAGGGGRRKLDTAWFRRPPARGALAEEARDVGRFLGLEIEV